MGREVHWSEGVFENLTPAPLSLATASRGEGTYLRSQALPFARAAGEGAGGMRAKVHNTLQGMR